MELPTECMIRRLSSYVSFSSKKFLKTFSEKGLLSWHVHREHNVRKPRYIQYLFTYGSLHGHTDLFLQAQ